MAARTPKPGADFERDIAATFKGYADGNIARLAMMPVPMAPTGFKCGSSGKYRPTYSPKGKAPFDVYGYLLHDGRFIGAELKSSKREASLPIVKPGRSDPGIQFHQLDALAAVALAHGIARIVWHNGGDVGILTEDDIVTAWQVYEQALTSERADRDAPQGSKSIKWERFTPVEWTNLHGTPGIDWLRADLIK